MLLTTLFRRSGAQLITDVISSNPDLSQFYAALQTHPFFNTLSEPGPFTIFAVNNAAFDASPLFPKYNDPEWSEHREELLDQHISPGIAIFTDAMTQGLQIWEFSVECFVCVCVL